MTDNLKSQLLGISLATATAIGCIAYERLVKAFQFPVVACLVAVSYAGFIPIGLWLTKDYGTLTLANFRLNKWSIALFLASGVTCPIWYAITRRQGVLVGGIYEMKYVVILAVGYALFGQGRITTNTLIGMVLALASVYFVSKS